MSRFDFDRKIREAQSPEEFLRTCAVRMTAIADLMRNDCGDPVQGFSVSPRTHDEITKVSNQRKILDGMTAADMTICREAELKDALEAYECSIEGAAEVILRYEAFRAEIEAWEPADPGHQTLQSIALKTIGYLIEDLERLLDHRKIPNASNNRAWARKRRKQLSGTISGLQRHLRYEEDLVARANKWLDEIKLPEPPAEV